MADVYETLAGLLHPAAVSAIVSGIFITFTPFRLYSLRNAKSKVKPGARAHVKLCIVALLAALAGGEIAMATVLSKVPIYEILDVAFSFAGVVALAWLSFHEHRRSVQPSTLVCLYLLASIASDLYRFTFPEGIYRKHGPFPFINTLIAQMILKTVLLVLESRNKTNLLLVDTDDYAETDLVGVLNRVSFWWINPILKVGNKRILKSDDMPRLDGELDTAKLRDRVVWRWNNRETPEPKAILARILYRTVRKSFWLAAIPRLFVILFRCGQPILINKVIAFVQHPPDSYTYIDQAFYIMLASVTIYIGLIFATSQYEQQLSRLEIMIRSSLTALIYNKTLSRNYDDVDAGQAMTLMGSDVDGVSDTAEMAHETWAYVTELVIGVAILASQVKWFWPVPLAIIFLCSRISKYVAQNLRPRQKAWSEATQLRMSVLTPALSSMKAVKATGISGNLEEYVESLREKEIEAAKHLAWMQVVYNASANALGIFSPAITVVLFATVQHARGEALDSQVMFTTIAVLSIITHPANMVMTIIPRVITSVANFERLQEYLQATQSTANTKQDAQPSNSTDVVTLADFTFSAAKDSRKVLDSLNLTLKEKTTTICCGPVGSGKSVLARGILGEIQQSHGVFHRKSLSLGFCDQNPWIPTGTIKEIICGFSTTPDERRYNEILEACCLSFDLLALPARDLTWIGSRGINISGGQKQRIAVARLLYSGCTVAVFDDAFAALDGVTEQTVVQNLFGPEVFVKRSNMTVFWVTNSAQYFHMADNIIVLNNGAIEKQGPWEDLKEESAELRKFAFKDSTEQEQQLLPQDLIKKKAKDQAEKDAEADLHRRTGDTSLYGYYLRAAGLGAVILVPVTCLYSFGNTVPSYWVKIWTEDQSHFALYAIGYALIAFLAWASTSINMWSFAVLMGPTAGRTLHQKLLTSIFGAPLEYFSNLDVGVTLNRFGQDIGLVDRQLARAFATFAIQVCKMATQVIVILTVQKFVSATLPVCAIVTYFVQKIYLRTSRQLRVLEIEAKASLYSTFVETVEGVLTIRAFGWQNAVEAKTLSALDVSLRPYYLLRCLQRWLNLVLELIVGTIAIGMIAMTVIWGYGSGTDIGVALNVVLVANTTLVRLVQSWASLEVSLGAVARLKNVEEHTVSEDRKSKTIVPDQSWPSHGKLMLSDVTLGYSVGNPVLKKINLTVEPGQKLVVCGRTGSGKSTVFLGLLSLIESEGTILVDGVDLGQVPKPVIRERAFIAVPQDAGWIPHASLRFNIDPALLASDYVLQDALEKAGLWDALSGSGSSVEKVLDLPLRSLPTLSVGQSQLLAIARAITKKQLTRESQIYTDDEEVAVVKPIVLLDEITSSMDAATESKIYDIIDSEFVDQGYTVIIVSHRVGALGKRMRPGKDAIAVVDDGGVILESDFAKFLELESQEAASS